MEPLQRPQCSRIILKKEFGEAMQLRYELLYKNAIIGKAKKDFLVSKITILLNMLMAIQNQDKRINGFRIHLGLDTDGLLFLFKGIIGLDGIGDYFWITPNGNSYEIVDGKRAEACIDKYGSEILRLPEIDRGLQDGNTSTYVYEGLLQVFISELIRHDSNSPVNNIKIKPGVCIDLNHPEYIDRIAIGFSFMIGSKEIHLTDVPGSFGCDMPTEHPFNGLGADTGTPCPPNKNCPTKELSQEYN